MRGPYPESLPRGGVDPLARRRFADLLAGARERTLALVAPVSEADMDRQHSELMSPLAWDLGHIAAFEDLWLAHRAGGLEPLRPDLWDVYDATETPRRRRSALPFLPAAEARDYLTETRERSLTVLEEVDVSGDGDGINRGGFVWEMVARHERQHAETMTQALKLAPAGLLAAPRSEPSTRAAPSAGPEMARIEAGRFPLGAADAEFAYDNERPRHESDLGAYEIDRLAVTTGAFLDWVRRGGYRRREWWSNDGWAWRVAEGVERPLYWTADGAARSFGRVEALDPDEPVMHVSWYEADAYARAHGKRLPTEAEWEKAASWDPVAERKTPYPWGYEEPRAEHANLGGARFGPGRAGSLPAGASATGVLGMVGDTWEWTASEFAGYPGFRAWPYSEYSEIFFGLGYRVLRGGSWATGAEGAGTTFRNWDLPQRRQIFAGFRCARSVGR